VKEKSGFGVIYGPVRACDLTEYLRAGRKATADMRTVHFGFLDRAELTPMELVPALRKSPLFLLGLFVFFGLRPQGILFREALFGGLPFAVLGLLMVLAGCFFAPLLLPVVSSYLTLNFTGCTPFTGVSGVKRELGAAIPLYIAAVALAGVFAVLFILRTWGVL
jgi:hypothetical protein